jgi:ribosomal protein S18 acetylase RimI-like enzyme
MLLHEAPEQRVTLLVRPEPEARPAQLFYERLGFRPVGTIQPWLEAPVYTALVRDLAA